MSVDFDACEHKMRQLIIRAGNLLREAKGLPQEKNITTLYRETAPLFGRDFTWESTQNANHLPTPRESAKQNPLSPWVFICPKCGEKAYSLTALCRSCEASEGGKYKVQFECFMCNHTEKSEEHLVVWLEKLGIEFGNQTKASLGIKTRTDEGLK